MAPPPGVTASPTHPSDTLYPTIVATSATCIILTTFFTSARLIVKRAVPGFNVEDYLLIASWILFIGFATTFLLASHEGMGLHMWDIYSNKYQRVVQMKWALEVVYSIFMAPAKVALVLQLQRIFVPCKQGAVYIACQTLIWLNIALYLSTFISMLVECTPRARIWNPSITAGYCVNVPALCAFTAIINVISDFAILFLPIWAVFHLRLSLKRKISISAVFATGSLALTCSICRVIYSWPLLTNPDTYPYAQMNLWSLGEMTSIIICTCSPLMPRFIGIITGSDRRRSQASSQEFDNAKQQSTSSHARNLSSKARCADCKHGLPCPVHDTVSGTFVDKDDGEQHWPNPKTNKATTIITEQPYTPTESSYIESPASTFFDGRDSHIDDSPLPSNGHIIIRREFHVQRDMPPELTIPGSRASHWETGFTPLPPV